MEVTLQKSLTSDEIRRLSSVYLDAGLKQEAWEIVSVTIDGPLLDSRVRMTATSASPTDAGGFHLTIFTAMEFLSQLANIYFHVWAGYEDKTREVWMRESSIRCKRSIRDAERISVALEVRSLRQSGAHLLGLVHFRITDPGGGCFEGSMKGLLT